MNDYFNRTEFNREQWINWEETETTAMLRWNMVHDLTSEYELIGMTRAEIIELFGQPEDEYKYSNSISYFLGMSGHGIDTGTLRITFENDKVVDYVIWRG